MPVRVVIVHWNQPGWLADTFNALAQDQGELRVVVVDNGSSPASLLELSKVVAAAAFPVDQVMLARNAGFGPGANAGLRYWLEVEDLEWAVVMPHDALPAPYTIPRLVSMAAARAHAGLACADVGDGESPVVDPYFGGMTVPAGVTEGWEAVDYPHGTLMLLRRDCVEEIGLFDERYFAYCEEADLGLRASAAGWEIGLARGVMVRNPTMRSGNSAVDYLMHRNTLLLVREHSGRYHAFIRCMIAVWQTGRGIVQPSNRTWLYDARGRVWGVIDFLRGRFGPPPDRLFSSTLS